MDVRIATPHDVPAIVAVVSANASPDFANKILHDVDTPQGQFHWVVAENAAGVTAAAHIVVMPPPPIYDLDGGVAGIVLGHWSAHNEGPGDALAAALESHLREQGVAMLVIACRADQDAARAAVVARGFRATTNFMLKTTLAPGESAPIRGAGEHDVPDLVAFNREARQRLHEANPEFWRSHPDADARFGLWMKFSLTMRDRSMFVSHHAGRATGFIIAQPASPVPLSIAAADNVGVIDDFHCATFGRSLDHGTHDGVAGSLLTAAESDFIRRGKSTAMAVCPVAWKSKSDLLTGAGYVTQFTWFTKKA